MIKSSSDSSGGFGNTKQIPPSKRWCLTWNNYPENWINLLSNPKIDKYIYGLEVGETGTDHVQGYVEFIKKDKPLTVFKDLKSIHWEKAKGSRCENVSYCSKNNNITCKGLRPLAVLHVSRLYDWQKQLIEFVQGTPCDRKIKWVYDTVGGAGKTALCKHICYHYNALIVGGKSADIKNGIVNFNKTQGHYPEIVIFDLARSINKISYMAIEEVKNGLFFSGKYEGGMCLFNSPHVIVFANEPPESGKMSEDRWDISCLDDPLLEEDICEINF